MSETHPSPAGVAQAAAYSSFADSVVGWLLAAVSLLAGLEAFGLFRYGWLYVWPGLLFAAGLFVMLYILWASRKHRLPLARVLAGPHQKHDFALAALATAGGLGEIGRVAWVMSRAPGFVWPVALVVLGYLFTTYTQDVTPEAPAKTARAHRRIGSTLIVAGLARGLEAVFGVQPGAVGTGWFVVLFVAAVLLLRYREAEGAYAASDVGSHTTVR